MVEIVGINQAKYDGDMDLGISNGNGDKGTYLVSILELEQKDTVIWLLEAKLGNHIWLLVFLQIVCKNGEIATKQSIVPSFKQNHSFSDPEVLQVALIMIIQGKKEIRERPRKH